MSSNENSIIVLIYPQREGFKRYIPFYALS